MFNIKPKQYSKIAILLWSAPFEIQNSIDICHQCKSWLENGNTVSLFGYYNGVFHFANNLLVPPEKVNIPELWQSIHNKYPKAINFKVCLSACLKRGLASLDIPKDNLSKSNLYNNTSLLYNTVSVGGVGDWVEMMLEADYILEIS